jgi:hypothetical protein
MKKKGSKSRYPVTKQTNKSFIALEQSGFYELHPTWSFKYCDFDHTAWGISARPDNIPGILRWLASVERQTWNNILTSTAGRKHNTRNHHIAIIDILSDAQKRLSEIKLEHFSDELYSLAISGKERLWGFLAEGVFHIVWYDPNHEIYQAHKRNT